MAPHGKEIEVRGGRDGEELSSQDIRDQLKEFEESNDSEQSGGEEEEVLL
jgi:hypothetical protein